MEIATLGGGCFWCLEAVYVELKGVQSVVSGYSAGHVPNPTYEQICGKMTGHAEVVQVTYDPAEVSYEQLLQVFFTIHDPTTPNRQGHDVGPQYRSIILTHNDEQKAIAEQVIQDVNDEGIWPAPIVTEVEPLDIFYRAEDGHQNYYARNPYAGYCRVVIAPKVAKFRQKFVSQLKR